MIDYSLPTSLIIGDEEHPINADFRAVLDVITALNDANLTEQERAYVALYIFYKGNLPQTETLLREAAEKMNGFIAAGTEDYANAACKPIINWERDFGMICPAVNRVLGYECRSVPFLHWFTFVAAYMEIGECLFSIVVGIRDKKANGKKLEKYEQEFIRRNPQYFRKEAGNADDIDLTEMIRRGELG